VTVMDCVARMAVNETVRLIGRKLVWVYQCRIEFMPLDELSKAVPYATADRLKPFLEQRVTRKLRQELGKLIAETKDMKVKAIKRSKVAATGNAGAGEEEAGNEEPDEEQEEGKKTKKKRKVLGAEDKAEEEERVAEEIEEGGDEEESLSSGMYSTEDEGQGAEDIDELELAGAEEAKINPPDDEEAAEAEEALEEGQAAKAQKEEEQDDEDDEDDDEEGEEEVSPKAKRPKKGDTGGTKEEEEKDDGEDGGSGGKQKAKKPGAKQGPSETKGKKTKGAVVEDDSASGKRLQKQAEADLAEALAAQGTVWCSELRGNSLTYIVKHDHAQCPHSLFVGEVLRNILSTLELQDPACAGVKNVHVKVENDKVSLECEGINLFGLQCLPATLVDHNTIYTNDIRHVLEMFGVEAARASVVREVRNVFGHYGIQVDHRHLSLIADYMAQAGDLRPFNRLGMINCTSPLLQMSYETTMQFLSTACKEDLLDNMVSPASSIVLGQPPAVGTGVVNLLVDLDPPDPPWKKQKLFKF